MDLSTLFFLSSALFLGWSLGANDTGNIFGVAVGSRMIKYRTATIICAVFVIIGALNQGSAAANTISSFSKVTTLAGAFVIALSAAIVVYNMVRLGLPSSITQSIIGSIVGWSLFAHADIDINVLTRIMLTWILCPILAAVIAVLLYLITAFILKKAHIHLLRLDFLTRLGLLISGAFGAYALGANNVGNVMGTLINIMPLSDTAILGLHFSAAQQLIFIGAISIAAGALTYSRRSIHVVGSDLSSMSPIAAWIVISSHSLVLFIFSSQTISQLMGYFNLQFLLIPVSSTQAIIGAITGLGLLRNRESLNWAKIINICIGWLVTPLCTAVLCFVMLFFMQNVFNQQVV